MDLILTPDPDEFRTLVKRTTTPPPRPTADILAQLNAARQEAAEQAAPTAPSLFPEIDIAERNSAIEDIMRELLEDPEAAFRSVAVLYQDFLVRCRIRRVQGEPLALPEFRRKLSVVKAGISKDTATGDQWQLALAMSEKLAEDVQGVFLIVARAAVEGAPCPSDAALAKAYGSYSTRRARRLLTYFEEQGLIVVQTTFGGQRVVIFPDLNCKTAAGDPNAPDA